MTHHHDMDAGAPPRRRRCAWVGFAAVAALAVVGLFVLDGAIAGAVMLAAMLGFIGACIYALRAQDADTLEHADRTALSGWTGGF